MAVFAEDVFLGQLEEEVQKGTGREEERAAVSMLRAVPAEVGLQTRAPGSLGVRAAPSTPLPRLIT